MGLLDEIQQALLNDSVSISSCLRKAKVLAFHLGNEDFKRWVDRELEGYRGAEDEEVPDYRYIFCRSYGNFQGPFGSHITNALIPVSAIPERIKPFAERTVVRDGVKTLESNLRSGDDHLIQWPPEFAAALEEVYDDMYCAAAFKPITAARIEGMLDSIRNKLLDLVLEIRKLDPSASDLPSLEKVTPGQVEHVFNAYIHGGSNIFGQGSNVPITGNVTVIAGDKEALLSALTATGISKADADELIVSIDSDGPAKKGRFGPKVASWIGKMIGYAASGSWDIALGGAAGTLERIIGEYYGLR